MYVEYGRWTMVDGAVLPCIVVALVLPDVSVPLASRF